MKNEIIDINKEYRKELIKRINECSSVNKNCDYLLEHDEIDELMEYIKELENKWNKPKAIKNLTKEQLEDMCLTLMHNDHEKAKIIEKLENNWDDLKEHIKNEMFIQDKLGSYAFVKFYSDLLDKMEEIESRK